MKTSSFVSCLLIGCLWPLGLIGSAPDSTTTTLSVNDPVRIETDLIAKAREAALRGDEGTADTQIMAAGTDKTVAPSVLLARRAMAVCGWLHNDNEFGRAQKIADRVLKKLAGMRESNDADRAERLYWEALLEGRILDNKKIALDRLAAAKKIKPDDIRVLDLENEFTAAVALFGR